MMIFAEQRRAGITLSCGAFNILNDESDFRVIEECNRKVLKLHTARPKEFLPGVNVHPNFPEESCRKVQKFYDLGFRVIGKIAYYVKNYTNYFSHGLLPVMELAQDRKMVLNIHPSNLEEIEKNPEKLSVAETGGGAPRTAANYG